MDGGSTDSGTDGGAVDSGTPDAGICGPLDALVVSFSFNEGAGPVANDSSGFGNDGSLMGSPTWVAGAEGTGLRFDGARTTR